MMEEIVRALHDGGYSCVVANGKVYTFRQHGVADLYGLLKQDETFLKGASVADKVVGKAAAALMTLGGIKRLCADVISSSALALRCFVRQRSK